MSKTETGKIENDHTARMLSDDELDAVSGGWSLGASNPTSSFYDMTISH